MKTIFFLSLISFSAFAQNTQVVTLSDSFATRNGQLIEKNIYNIGVFKDLNLTVIKYKDLFSNATYSSLKFKPLKLRHSGSELTLSALDKDEVPKFLSSIKMLKDKVLKSTRDTYTEIIFNSRSGFLVGAYYETETKKWIYISN